MGNSASRAAMHVSPETHERLPSPPLLHCWQSVRAADEAQAIWLGYPPGGVVGSGGAAVAHLPPQPLATTLPLAFNGAWLLVPWSPLSMLPASRTNLQEQVAEAVNRIQTTLPTGPLCAPTGATPWECRPLSAPHFTPALLTVYPSPLTQRTAACVSSLTPRCPLSPPPTPWLPCRAWPRQQVTVSLAAAPPS